MSDYQKPGEDENTELRKLYLERVGLRDASPEELIQREAKRLAEESIKRQTLNQNDSEVNDIQQIDVNRQRELDDLFEQQREIDKNQQEPWEMAGISDKKEVFSKLLRNLK